MRKIAHEFMMTSSESFINLPLFSRFFLAMKLELMLKSVAWIMKIFVAFQFQKHYHFDSTSGHRVSWCHKNFKRNIWFVISSAQQSSGAILFSTKTLIPFFYFETHDWKRKHLYGWWHAMSNPWYKIFVRELFSVSSYRNTRRLLLNAILPPF